MYLISTSCNDDSPISLLNNKYMMYYIHVSDQYLV